MRHRKFRFAGFDTAHEYATHLMENGISFSAYCNVDFIDIETPFELAPQDFPITENLISIGSGGRFSDDPDNHCGKWARR